MTIVEELLREKIEEVFIECQNRRHITDGGITPLDAMKLDKLIGDLTHHITNVLDYQECSHLVLNGCAVIEVLEDFHIFKRGTTVIAIDNTDTQFVVEYNNVLYYIPQDKCRLVA